LGNTQELQERQEDLQEIGSPQNFESLDFEIQTLDFNFQTLNFKIQAFKMLQIRGEEKISCLLFAVYPLYGRAKARRHRKDVLHELSNLKHDGDEEMLFTEG